MKRVSTAGSVLRAAILSGSGTEREAAAVQVAQLLTLLATTDTRRFTDAIIAVLGPPETEVGSSPIHRLAAALRRRETAVAAYVALSRMLLPRWLCGGEHAGVGTPPFDEIKDDLMAGLDCGVMDFEGMIATLIGRYGPEAASVLNELVGRLRRFRTDCSKAPGLTWAVAQIGGMRPAVRNLLIAVASKPDSCPHSQRIASEILALNGVRFRKPRRARSRLT